MRVVVTFTHCVWHRWRCRSDFCRLKVAVFVQSRTSNSEKLSQLLDNIIITPSEDKGMDNISGLPQLAILLLQWDNKITPKVLGSKSP